jgi:methyl-accepting chemotaxis protein
MNLVKKSLYLCIGMLLMLIALQAALSLWQVSRLSDAAQTLVVSSRLHDHARSLWIEFLDAEQAFKQATAFTDAGSADEQRQAFESKVAALRARTQALEQAAGEDHAAVRQVASGVDAWMGLASPHVGAAGVTELPSYHRLDAARVDLGHHIGALIEHAVAATSSAASARESATRQAYGWTLACLAAAVALGAALVWHALRSLHRQLGADAGEVARIANAVADGDLAVQIRTEGVPAGSVMSAMARMQQALHATVMRVRGISSGLADGANEIAGGNTDLSQRTEQQAAALERTTSTMHELGRIVRDNTSGATQASELAEQASGIARRGSEVVNQAVQTMHGINESSHKIGEITSVIDGIAFQTNILALNAAVEAARAGEQGRGFAVVAGEVRTLAQRSAAAAREIKALIGTSVDRVETGSALINEAGRTMQEVVSSIQRVAEVSAEIRDASVAQTAGVDQIGQAIAELDRGTQQNAALAEQSAAAAESLQGQGRHLMEAIAFFRLTT